MNVRTLPPTLAGRGGHDDEPSAPVRAPRGRAEEALTPRDRLRQAEAEARNATAAAEEAEAEVARNRTVAKKAAEEAKRQVALLERQEQAWAQEAGRQVMTLEDQLRRLISAKVPPPAVAGSDRSRARLYLHGAGADHEEALQAVSLLKRADPFLGQLFSIHQQAGSGLEIATSQHDASDEILAKLDRVECTSWREILRRCRAIAGEEDWS